MDHDQDLPGTTSEEPTYGSRPVAIGGGARTMPVDEAGMPGEDHGGSPTDEVGASPPYIHDERPVIEDARGELLVGFASAVLAASVFLPWYRTFGQFDISGWASGTWGPLVFFLAVAGVAIIGLRRIGVALAFPVAYSLLLEGIGWVSVLALLIKRFRTPENFSVVGLSANPLKMGFWIALLAAVAVAMLASRLSRNAPIVVLPGWFRSKAGKVGALLLSLSLVAGVAFGLLNDAGEALARARGLGQPGSLVGQDGGQPDVEQGLPKCMKDIGFETPEGMTATQGFSSEANGICTAQFTSKQGVDAVAKAFRAAMQQASWTFEVLDAGAAQQMARSFAVSAPKCGTVQIFDDQQNKQRTAQALLGGEQFCQAIQQQEQTPN